MDHWTTFRTGRRGVIFGPCTQDYGEYKNHYYYPLTNGLEVVN